MLADAASLNLLADMSSASLRGPARKDARASVTPFPGTTADACRTAFKQAENDYKVAVRVAKEKRDLAVRAKTLCLQKISESRKPSSTPSALPRR